MRRAIVAMLSSITLLASLPAGGQAIAPEKVVRPVTVAAHAAFDLVGVAGGEQHGVRGLAEGDLTVTADLGHYLDVSDFTMSTQLLAVAGGRPNDLAGTVQGIDNIEVSHGRIKLYQLWVRKGLFGGRVSVLAGLADLNAEFYQNDAAALLVAPAFGVGSELAASGPNGPSIFPATALTVRLGVNLGRRGYARVAVVNAEAGVLGEHRGWRGMTREGVLTIGEAGVAGDGKLAVGLWRYSKRQPTVGSDAADDAMAGGAYLLAEHRLVERGADRTIDAFLRIGVSDGRTTSFKGGYQFGVLARGVFAARPASQLSVGVNGGRLADGTRAALAVNGIDSAACEHGAEITYRDNLTRVLSIQPDLQYIRRAYADRGDRDTAVGAVRLAAQW